MSGFGRGVRPLLLVIAVAFLAITFSGCSRERGDYSFSVKLTKIDSLIVAGRDVKARKAMKSLRKDAKSASQWLSIVKRERGLGDFRGADKTLAMAMKALPASESIIACRVDVLLELGGFDEAVVLSSRLDKARYGALTSYAEISKALSSGSAYPSPESFLAAYGATGNPLFRRDAAVLLAASGRYAEALSLADADNATDIAASEAFPAAADSIFWALLAYDARAFDRVISLFPDPADSRLDLESLSLVADAAWQGGNTELARVVWLEIVSRTPEASPIPYYDIALTALDPESTRTSLIRCVELFPAWYPAVARIVRSGGYHDSVTETSSSSASVSPDTERSGDYDELDDPVKKTLRSAGFLSLGMEAALHDGGFSGEEATATLERALASVENGGDVRLRIESIRLGLARDGNAVRSSSQMWNLIEAYRDNPVLYNYATWFFAVAGDYGASFSVNRANPNGPDPFYLGLEAASRGDPASAESEFSKVASSDADSWAALGNIARIAAKAGDYERAEESVRIAAEIAPNDGIRSRLLGESGGYLVALNAVDKAKKVLAYACDLDASNYSARARLRALESSGR